jgi:PAS domain S-box-containing protein
MNSKNVQIKKGSGSAYIQFVGSEYIPRVSDRVRNDLAYGLAFADESLQTLNGRQQQQLNISTNQLRAQKLGSVDRAPLPRTLKDALRHSHRAIVITEPTAPFRVVDVNRAWEELCGYSFVESKGRTLGHLLKGPDTNPLATTSLVHQLLQGEEVGTTLTNYTKDGRVFCNRLRAGPLFDGTRVTHFVGVLEEVHA